MNHETIIALLIALLTLSEALGGIKQIGENSVYQLVMKFARMAHETLIGKKTA